VSGIISVLLIFALVLAKAFTFHTTPKQKIIQFNTWLKAAPDNAFENESSEERDDGMKLVRQIQQSFYQSDADEENTVQPSSSEGVIENLPLWRVQWTELPGYQNILNVHVPHYTHMFRKIMAGPKPWRFGHIYLPGGSENLSNSRYDLNSEDSEATRIGKLMQISDVIELVDGRLAMVVQGAERFEVVQATQHAPYGIATIRLLPDDEFVNEELSSDSSKVANHMKDFEVWNEWEVLPTTWDEPDKNVITAISPLSNYNSQFFPDELAFDTASKTSNDSPLTEEMEYQVWVALDDMLRLLASVSGLNVPIPSQLLGLLPINTAMAWPAEFQLETYASTLEEKNADVGTYSKSPFVRVSLCESYPPLRRAHRLSYAIWILLDNLLAAVGASGKPSQQELLELTSVNDRLELAYRHLESINTALRKAIPR
jgi:Lon protease-like protein